MDIIDRKKFSGILPLEKKPVDILIVDDDADITEMLSLYFQNHNYTTEKVINPKYLPDVLAKVDPKLIVLDMLLYGKDGRDVCRAIRATESTKKVKIIMVSGHADAAWTCKDAGADEFLTKPFNLSYLGEVIKKNIADISA